ncbi:helix-turn-helix domain-containing protein [bacterium]|nr:helix-turn-helix domain-containing protein [bacterium]
MSTYDKLLEAIKVARLYYYQNRSMKEIAKEINVSRSTISRLLKFARTEGLINISIVDPAREPRIIEKKIIDKFDIKRVHVVQAPSIASEGEWLNRVAHYTARYLNTVFESNMTLGVAWGTTLTAISKCLIKKTTQNSHIVQLNGAGNTTSMGNEYAAEIIMRFADNYQARAHLFPLPTFFDYADTKQALWREKSIQRILDIQDQADILLYSIGAVNAGIPSHVYSDGYLQENNYRELKEYDVVGDIATVFFNSKGDYQNIPLNERASGPELDFFREKYGICVVSGLAKVHGLYSALKGNYLNELIIDEPTAQHLLKYYLSN